MGFLETRVWMPPNPQGGHQVLDLGPAPGKYPPLFATPALRPPQVEPALLRYILFRNRDKSCAARFGSQHFIATVFQALRSGVIAYGKDFAFEVVKESKIRFPCQAIGVRRQCL